MTVVRTWHGCVPVEHAAAYAKHLEVTGVQHAKCIAGNRGAFVKQEIHGPYAHFFLATYWESIEAIKAFAGENYSVAVRYPADEEFDLIGDPYVFHHEIKCTTHGDVKQKW